MAWSNGLEDELLWKSISKRVFLRLITFVHFRVMKERLDKLPTLKHMVRFYVMHNWIVILPTHKHFLFLWGVRGVLSYLIIWHLLLDPPQSGPYGHDLSVGSDKIVRASMPSPCDTMMIHMRLCLLKYLGFCYLIINIVSLRCTSMCILSNYIFCLIIQVDLHFVR